MQKRNRLSSVIALILVLCMLLSFCAVLSSCGKNNDPTASGDGSGNNNPDAAACEHTNTEFKNLKAVTCTEDGYTGDKVCKDCGATVQTGSAVTKTGHTTVLANNLAPTCTEEGYTGDQICTKCLKVITAGADVDPLGHQWGKGVVTKAASCMETGVMKTECKVCYEVHIDVIPLAAHNATYHDDKNGKHFVTCNTCSKNDHEQHNPVDNGVYYTATCESAAYTVYVCADCGGEYRVYNEAEPALGHDMSEWILIEATCQKEGSRTQSCKREGCSEVHSLPIPISASHDYVFSRYEGNQAPDCIHSAVAIYACEGCGDEITKDLPATGVHKYGEPVTEDNVTTKTCEVCQDVIKTIDASQETSANVPSSDIDISTPLEVETKEAAIQFPTDVLGVITSGTNLEISADKADENAKNAATAQIKDEDAKAAIQNSPVYDFTVKVDNKAYTDNFASKVAITLPYDNGDNDAEGIVIYYLAEDGTVQAITDVVYDAEKKEVTFFVEHFSFYAVTFQETQAMRCKRGNHDYKATSTVVAATCYQFGYTLFECSECGKQTLENFVARLNHDYGAPEVGTPTCEEASYTTKTCSDPNCGSVIIIETHGATGHTSSGRATCTEASVCTVCEKVLERATGHKWSDWEITKQPTELALGLRERHCTNAGCDEHKEETIEKVGTIVPIEFDSYSDMVNLVGEILNIKGAYFTATVVYEEKTYDITIKMLEVSNGYRISFEAICGDDIYEFFYDEGALVYIDTTGNSIITDVDHIVPLTIEVYKELLEEYYFLLDEYAIMGLEMAREFVGAYKEIYGNTVDQVLAAIGVPYTYDDLNKIIQSVESVYAYVSAKLGYTTSAKIEGETTLPTSEDFKAVLELVMNKSTRGDLTVYSLTHSPIYDIINEIVASLEEYSEKSVGEVLYVVYGEALKELDPSITSFDAFIDYIATIFPGDFTIQDAVDMYIAFAEENGLFSIDELYAYIDMIIAYASMFGGAPDDEDGSDLGEGYNPGEKPQPMPMPMEDSEEQQFGVKDFVEAYGEMTLDELVSMMTEEQMSSISEFYNNIKKMFAETAFGSVPMQGGMTPDAFAANLKAMAEMIDLEFALEFRYDSDGNLVTIYLDQSLAASMSPNADPSEIVSISFSFNRDDELTLDVPAAYGALMKNISTRYDDEGNLIVENLPVGVDFRISLMGYGEIAIKDAIVKDEELSAELGYDVYVLKEEYWNDHGDSKTYILYNGKYYGNYSHLWIEKADDLTDLSEIKDLILDQLENRLEDLNNEEEMEEKHDRQYVLLGTQTPVFDFTVGNTIVGKCYKRGDEWIIATSGKYTVINEHSYQPEVVFYDYMTLDQFVASLSVVSVSDASKYYTYSDARTNYYYVEYNGRNYPLSSACLMYGTEGLTFNVECVRIGGRTYFYGYDNSSYHYYVLEKNATSVTSLPAHDYYSSYSDKIATIDSNGNLSFARATVANVANVVPTYFVKINDEEYLDLERAYNIIAQLDTRNLKEETLPDGNKFYFIGSKENYYYGDNVYTVHYGYTKTVSGPYVRTLVFYNGESIEMVRYENANTTTNIDVQALATVGEMSVDGSSYKISKSLIERLQAICSTEETLYAIMLRGTTVYAGKAYEYIYTVDSVINVPDITSIAGSSASKDVSFEYFFGNEETKKAPYSVEYNDDGSVTLVFDKKYYISDVSVPSNAGLPVNDDLLVKNDYLSESYGLDIYTYNGSYTEQYSCSYVYINGVYYNYSTPSNYVLTLASANEIKANWRVEGLHYQFETLEDQEEDGFSIPAGTKFYNTEIRFAFTSPFGIYYGNSITLFTFYVNGIMYVAVEAEQIGNSQLKFERALPISEYMKSLVFEFHEIPLNKNGEVIYVDGKYDTLYNGYFDIYEVDKDGTKLDEPEYSIGCSYVMRNGVKRFITSYRNEGHFISIGSVANPDMTNVIDRESNAISYYNRTVTVVTFMYRYTNEYKANFVKLAGRLYRFDGGFEYSDFIYYQSYNNAKMSEDEFIYNNGQQIYYFYTEINGEKTYYKSYNPSDDGIILGDTIAYEDLEGLYYYENGCIGWTDEGYAVYEIVHIKIDDEAWEITAQDDGTVFYYRDGVGYLRVQERYTACYVRASLVENNGDMEVLCHIRSGKLTGSEANNYVDTYFSDLLNINGSEITITEQFFEAIEMDYLDKFYLQLHFYDSTDSGYGFAYDIDYYELMALFAK